MSHEQHQAGLASRSRKRATGTGARHCVVFIDRLLATFVHIRRGATHDVLACWFGVDGSAVTRAISKVRPVLAEGGPDLSVTPSPSSLFAQHCSSAEASA